MVLERTHAGTGENSVQLFNSADDPNELDPIEDQPERVATMLEEIDDWRASWSPVGGDTIELDAETRQHLRDLGYAE